MIDDGNGKRRRGGGGHSICVLLDRTYAWLASSQRSADPNTIIDYKLLSQNTSNDASSVCIIFATAEHVAGADVQGAFAPPAPSPGMGTPRVYSINSCHTPCDVIPSVVRHDFRDKL
jgi:hypothetical protein